jgi:hypothetical protein
MPNTSRPITVAARPKAWNVFARSNTGIVGSNPTEGMDVYVYSVFVSTPCPRSPTECLGLGNWSET